MISRRSLLGAGAGVGALALTGAGAGTTWAGSSVSWKGLAAQLRGRLVLPRDADYATAKHLYDQQFDAVSPQAVAFCANSSDVAKSLVFAQCNGIPFAVRSAGHSLGGYSTTTGLVVDVSGLNSIAAGDGSVTIGPGAQGVDVTNALGPAGLAVPGGYHPTVGSAGFFQGGGVGLLTRTLGMGCDRITSAQVVLADGTTVTASPRRNSDLFWALRGGGGGNFGVVTSLTLTPAAIPQVAMVNLVWSWDKAADMLDGYARWLVDLPHTVNGGAAVQLPDAAPGNVPQPYAFVASTTADTAELARQVARLVALTGAPVQQSPAAVVPYQALMSNFYGCATVTADQCHRADDHPAGTLPRPELYLLRSRMFKTPPPLSVWQDAVAVLETQRLAGLNYTLELVPFGGAVSDLGRTDTAFVHRDALFSVTYLADIETAAAADPAGRAAAHAFVDTGFSVLDPQSSGETYQNFIDPKLTGWARSYYAENYSRLSRIKAAYDPQGAFRFAQGVR